MAKETGDAILGGCVMLIAVFLVIGFIFVLRFQADATKEEIEALKLRLDALERKVER